MKNKLLKALISITVSMTLIVSFTPPVLADPLDVVLTTAINQPLYDALRASPYNLDPGGTGITIGDLHGLTGLLDLTNKGIENIDALVNCDQIQSLYLSQNPLTSLPANMSGMTALTLLTLGHVHNLSSSVSNYTAIITIPNLEALNLAHTEITNVSFLSTMPHLQILTWCDNYDAPLDLSSLSGLSHLTELNLSNDTGFGGDISALSALTGLTKLNIGSCGVTDISSLAGMSGLTLLNAGYNYIHDLTPISGKPLTVLTLDHNYLNPLEGPDKAILDTFPGADFSSQRETVIGLSCSMGHATFDGSTHWDAFTAIVYEQHIELPGIMELPDGFCFTGWDTNNDGAVDHDAGDYIDFTWPTLPIPSNYATFTAHFDTTTNCVLTSLSSSQPMSPAFSSTQGTYTVNLPVSSVDYVKIVPAAVSFGQFTIDGDSVPSKTYTLAFGETKVSTIVVTPKHGTGSITYTVTIRRAAPDNSRILTPNITPGTLLVTPAFNPNFNGWYRVSLAESESSVTFTPALANPAAKLYINGVRRTTYTTSLKTGQTKNVYIKVVSPTGFRRIYNFKVTRAKSTDAYLSRLYVSPTTLSLSPAFASGATAYSLTVPEGKSGVTVRAVPNHSTATVYINGSRTKTKYISISYGSTKTVTVRVKAQAGNVQVYTITLRRPPHISSFSGYPKAAGKPVVQANVAPYKPVKFTYSLARYAGAETVTTIDLYQSDGVTLVSNLLTRTDSAGTKTFTWDGKVGSPASSVPPGTYVVKLKVTYTHGGVTLTSNVRSLTVTVR